MRPPRPDRPATPKTLTAAIGGDAAADRIGHHVEDRAGVRGAAAKWVSASATKAEVRKACAAVIGGAGRRRARDARGMPCGGMAGGGLRISSAAGTSSDRRAIPSASMRRAPVVGRDQPAHERRHDERRHAHAGRDQRHREVAMAIEPGRGDGHQRRIEGAAGDADQDAEQRAGTASRLVAWLAATRPMPSSTAPARTTGRVPQRSLSQPQPKADDAHRPGRARSPRSTRRSVTIRCRPRSAAGRPPARSSRSHRHAARSACPRATTTQP